MNVHEFVRERGVDHEARYDEERLFARRRVQRQLLGIGTVLAAKFLGAYLAYRLAGWWAVAVFSVFVLAGLFMRGARGFSE